MCVQQKHKKNTFITEDFAKEFKFHFMKASRGERGMMVKITLDKLSFTSFHLSSSVYSSRSSRSKTRDRGKEMLT